MAVLAIFWNFAAGLSDIPSAVGLVGSIIGILGLAGGAVGYFKKSTGDSIIAYQAREIELRDRTNSILEKNIAALSAKCDSQAEQIETLTGLAQGAPELKGLTIEIKNLASAFAKHFKDERRRT